MAEILKTNICCLDLAKECLDYLKSLDLNVYEGTLGSVFSVEWGHTNYGSKPILIDINIPDNLHEYHVFIHDMENPHVREYKADEHFITHVENDEVRHLECRWPVNTLDLRPFGTHKLANRFRDIARERRIEILFVGRENIVEYWSNVIRGGDHRIAGTYESLNEWNLVEGKEKHGNRVLLEDNNISKMLFDGYLNNVNYLRVFSLPQEYDGDEKITDKQTEKISEQLTEKLTEQISETKQTKTDLSVQSSHYLLCFIILCTKKDMCHYHISGVA